MAKTHNVRRGTVRLLENLLSQNEWYKSKGARLAYHAGQILLNVIPPFTVPKDIVGDEEKVQGFIDEKLEITLNNKQVRVCRKCVSHFLDEGKLNITRYLAELLDVLEMQPSALDDDDLEDDLAEDEEGEE